METIFNYNPTDSELSYLFSYNKETGLMNHGFSIIPIKKQEYSKIITPDESILDIAQLLEYRRDFKTANKYWQKIPDIGRQYRNGFDYLPVPID